MTPSRHTDMTSLLGPAALGLLTSPEQRRLDAHLASCATCRDELAALSAVGARLGEVPADVVLDEPAASTRRTEAVLAAVARERQLERRRGQRLQALLAAAASVVVLAAGLVTAQALDAGPAAVVPLEAVAVSAPSGVDARADLVAHTWGVEIKLVAAGLATGRAYTVQVTTDGGEVVDAGAFLGTGEKTLRCNLNASVLRPDAASFAVLDEAGRQVLTADL